MTSFMRNVFLLRVRNCFVCNVFMCEVLYKKIETELFAQGLLSLLIGILLIFMVLLVGFRGYIQCRINDFRNWLNFRSQFLFDAMQIIAIFVRD